jgi:hypothetical protein
MPSAKADQVNMSAEKAIYHGTGQDILAQHPEILQQELEVRVLAPASPAPKHKQITFGMFPQFAGVTDEDIKSAEWHDPVEEF